MSERASPFSPVTRRHQRGLVVLLVAAGVVNYLDRSTLAIANTTIAGELKLSPSEMGALLSAFAWAYAVAQLPAGALTGRFGPRPVLAAAMIVWSLAQTISGAVGSYFQFLIARVGLGLGESPMFTAGARAIVDWYPLRMRGGPLGLFNSASSLGPAVAPPILTALMLAAGWRWMFVAMGAAGVLMAIAWLIFYRDPAKARLPAEDLAILRVDEHGGGTPPLGSWLALFRVPASWAMMGGLFGLVYVTWLYASWLPAYLETSRHVGTAATGVLAAIPQFAGFAGGCLAGYASDALARRGMEPVRARKLPTVIGLVLAAVLTALVPAVDSTAGVVGLISLAMFFAYAAGSCSWALGASLTPPQLVATLEAIQNVGGSFGGALAPFVTGIVVERTGGFGPAFLIAAAAAFASAVSYALVEPTAYRHLSNANARD